jgi:murein DD-endopeptidase MepM/ murein hydrolase activator NlpD
MGARRFAIAAAVAALVGAGGAAAAHAQAAGDQQHLALPIAREAREAAAACGGRPTGAAYGWPVKPFHRQQPVRGSFGDPRISDEGRSLTFHFGVDVAAPNGTAVYATADGIVERNARHRDVLSVRRADGVVFEYWHIEPAVEAGTRAVAYKTVLGHIEKPWAHVHFAEYRGGVYVNPLRPGAMGPYRDRTCPAVSQIQVERDGELLASPAVSGTVDLVAETYDMPTLSAPRPWYQMPVTPARVQWRIVTERGGRRVLGWQAAYDVRTYLRSASYQDVYADGTLQNWANRPGRYRFVLARGFDPSALGRGRYVVQVLVADTQGNQARGRRLLVVP